MFSMYVYNSGLNTVSSIIDSAVNNASVKPCNADRPIIRISALHGLTLNHKLKSCTLRHTKLVSL